MSRPSIGVTGGRGVLAQILRETWTEADYRFFEGDVANFDSVHAWLQEAPLEGLIHLAARVPTGRVESDPWSAFQSNVVGTCNILEAARGLGGRCPWLFIASTSHVYRSSSSPLAEDAELQPISLYGQTKREAEQWATLYQSKFLMPICVGRIFSYTAPAQPTSYLVPGLFQKFRQAEPNATLEVHGLAGSRDFLAAHQVAAIIAQLFQKRAVGVFNVASGQRLPLAELVEEIRKLTHREDVQVRSTGGDHQDLVADISRLQDLGIFPQLQLGAMLENHLAREAT